jgi:hypothetical protein
MWGQPGQNTSTRQRLRPREYFIPDFSNCKDHDSYQEAFKRLISDLKSSDVKPT